MPYAAASPHIRVAEHARRRAGSAISPTQGLTLDNEGQNELLHGKYAMDMYGVKRVIFLLGMDWILFATPTMNVPLAKLVTHSLLLRLTS